MKNWKPIVIYSKFVPWLSSKFSGTDIEAVSFFIFTFAKEKLPARLETHETIHFQQQLELLFVFHWILYGIVYLYRLIKYRNSLLAYRYNLFEREAYANDYNPQYPRTRKRYSWIHY